VKISSLVHSRRFSYFDWLAGWPGDVVFIYFVHWARDRGYGPYERLDITFTASGDIVGFGWLASVQHKSCLLFPYRDLL